ncbi:hypothetical protein K1719_011318 [Acacia pycnantha]|nr:hypothetical protein K1719_011318 [Acacia pycnantha]
MRDLGCSMITISLVQRWRPNFNPWRAARQRRIAVWVRIPDLPLEFCTVESLGLIGNMIGRIIKIDRSTSIYDKGAFARICVEIDLQRPLLPAFMVFGETKQLVYEGLHLVCFGCGLYGHDQKACPNSMEEDRRDEVRSKKDTTEAGVDKSEAVQGQTGKNDEARQNGIDSAKQETKPTQEVPRKEEDNHRRPKQGAGPGSEGRKKVGDEGVPEKQITSVDYSRNIRQDFLGPHMLLSRESRRSSYGVEGSGGVKQGTVGVKIGMKLKGVNNKRSGARDETLLLEKKKETMLEKKKEIVDGPDLKKSNGIYKDMGKAKSEWMVVGSKRKKKEENPKTFGNENRMRGRPKSRPMELGNGGAHLADVTNKFLPLQEIPAMDATFVHGKLHETVTMEGPSSDCLRTEKNQVLVVQQKGDILSGGCRMS